MDLNSYIKVEKKDSFTLSQAYRYLGNSYYELKNFETSLTKFDTSILYNQSSGWAYYERGDVFIALQRKDDACKDFSKAVELGVVKAASDIKRNCN